MKRVLHALLLIFAFLFAQAGGAAHAAGHFTAAGHDSDQSLPADAGCELCVGYAQLAGGAPLPDTLGLPVCSARFEAPESFTALLLATVRTFSRARAPPVFS